MLISLKLLQLNEPASRRFLYNTPFIITRQEKQRVSSKGTSQSMTKIKKEDPNGEYMPSNLEGFNQATIEELQNYYEFLLFWVDQAGPLSSASIGVDANTKLNM